MYSQSNINNILDHQHTTERLIGFRHIYFLAVRMDLFSHFTSESALEMLTTVKLQFNKDIGVFSSTIQKEIKSYATFLIKRFGMQQGKDYVSADCTNLALNGTYKACLIENAPWIAILTGREENYITYIPENFYNKIDYVFRQYQLINPDDKLRIQTEGVTSGLIKLL